MRMAVFVIILVVGACGGAWLTTSRGLIELLGWTAFSAAIQSTLLLLVRTEGDRRCKTL